MYGGLISTSRIFISIETKICNVWGQHLNYEGIAYKHDLDLIIIDHNVI